MYVPKLYLASDSSEILAFMRQYSFATIITSDNNMPTATHLPFVVLEEGEQVKLISHYAKANPQWHDLEKNPVLVIFNEPHAYISPKHYDQEMNVPTWNYVAVHVYGKATLLTDQDASFDVLEKMINSFEADYQQQWDRLPLDYKLKMLKGIVAFEIDITDIQAKKKLSQNKNKAEKNRIIDTLSNSPLTTEQEIAKMMKKVQ
jgi:transcriptional regulator